MVTNAALIDESLMNSMEHLDLSVRCVWQHQLMPVLYTCRLNLSLHSPQMILPENGYRL